MPVTKSSVAINPKIGVPFDELVTQGGDDRLELAENGLNKYNVRPTDFETVFNRASCTCSPFTPEGYRAAVDLYQKLDPDVFDETRKQQTQTIKELINYDGRNRFHVFYAPSGSDLCYLPLLFSKLINPDRNVFNVITCPEELGSGSISAYSGKYYFERNQMGEPVPKGESLGSQIVIENENYAARAGDGTIINHWPNILQKIHEKYHTHSVNANLVIGSKSGIENNITYVSQAPENVLWTIDLCQFRASRVLINGLIGMNCLVMLTGSKFYQSPPFCAVLLVPKTITKHFGLGNKNLLSPFSTIFSRHDVPEKFSSLREHLPDYRNYGLLLRWEAALTEMVATSRLDSFDLSDTIQKWNRHVVERLGRSKNFKMMPDQQVTNNSIVSFRVLDDDGRFLSHNELRTLYQKVCQRDDLPLGKYCRALFGQPVKYGDRSFIRMALGSAGLRDFVDNGLDFDNDDALIDILEETVKSF